MRVLPRTWVAGVDRRDGVDVVVVVVVDDLAKPLRRRDALPRLPLLRKPPQRGNGCIPISKGDCRAARGAAELEGRTCHVASLGMLVGDYLLWRGPPNTRKVFVSRVNANSNFCQCGVGGGV